MIKVAPKYLKSKIYFFGMSKVAERIKIYFEKTLRKQSTILFNINLYLEKNLSVENKSFSTVLGYKMGGNRRKDLGF